MAARNGKHSRLPPEERRQQILRCARMLFVERGYQAVSTAEIARAAGVTSALIHHYFGSKDRLYFTVARQIIETARDVSAPAPDDKGSLEANLEATVAAAIEAWLDFVEHEGTAWLAVTAQGDAVSHSEIMMLVNDARDACARRMLRTYADVVADTPATRFAIRSFILLNESVSRQWLASEVTREHAQQFLIHTLLDILLRAAPALDTIHGMRAEGVAAERTRTEVATRALTRRAMTAS